MARSLFTLSPARESASRRPALPSIPMIVLSFTLVLAGIVGGSLLALQGQARPAAPADTTARTDNPALVDTTIRNLEADQASLKRSLAAAREQLDTLQATSAQEKAQLADVTSALAAEQVTAGLVPLTGPGVIAVFQDSTAATVPANEPAAAGSENASASRQQTWPWRASEPAPTAAASATTISDDVEAGLTCSPTWPAAPTRCATC